MTNMRDALLEPLKAAGEQLKLAGEKAVQTSTTLNAKVLDHAEANVREAFAAMRNAAASKSITDVMNAQSTYLREQSERALGQVKEIGDMVADFGREAMRTVTGKD